MTKKTILAENPGGGKIESAADYYSDLTDFYLAYGGEDGWHYGIWEEDIRTKSEALLRLNDILARDIEIEPGSRVLDVGCGIGAFAAWLAKKFGCRVMGITVNPEHIKMAEGLAERLGVRDLCEFRVMDMNKMDLPDSSFKYIFNQETFCYGVDKHDYLRQVLRLLRPGGIWSASAFALRNGVLSSAESVEYEKVRQGFRIPDLVSPFDVNKYLGGLGYVDIRYRDLTPLVLETARYIINCARFPLLLFRLRIAWVFFRMRIEKRRHIRGHFLAGDTFSRGLIDGYFEYSLYRARKPHKK